MIRNPVLPGFNPDPSFGRVGQDFHIATSTFEWYPDAPDATPKYRVDAAERSVTLSLEARVSAPCPVSLASHAYFNLDGDARSVLAHRLRIAAAAMLQVAPDMIPLGHAAAVQGDALRPPHPAAPGQPAVPGRAAGAGAWLRPLLCAGR